MDDKNRNFQGMALNVLGLLTDEKPTWEPLYKKMLPDYTALETALGLAGAKAQKLTGGGSEGYTDAKTTQQTAALAAAEPVLGGIKALQLDAPRPALKAMSELTMSDLKNLRDQEQVDTLTELHALALPLAGELAEEQVTAAQLEALHDKTELYRPLVGTPRQEIVSGSVLLAGAEDQLDLARAALERLDVRVPNLKSAMPDFVKEYFRLRAIVDAGHGPKGGGPA